MKRRKNPRKVADAKKGWERRKQRGPAAIGEGTETIYLPPVLPPLPTVTERFNAIRTEYLYKLEQLVNDENDRLGGTK